MPSKTREYQPVPVKEAIFSLDNRRDRVGHVTHKGFDFFTRGKRLSVEKHHSYRKHAELFSVLYYNMATFYSVAPNYFPKTIELDRPLDSSVVEMIEKYYDRMSLELPNIISQGVEFFEPESYELDAGKVVIGLSGGKDSVYALVRAVEKYGADNVLAVHVDNIMKQIPEQERSASATVCKMLGVKLEIIRLQNSFKRHPGILNGAEIALATALVIPIAVDFGARKVVLGTIASEVEPFHVQAPTFSECGVAIALFNKFLETIGVGVTIESGVPDTSEPIVYLMKNYPDIMAETVSCMMRSNHLVSHMNRSRKNYPDFPFYKRMCGVCVKCIMINTFRLRYDKSFAPFLKTPSVSKWCNHVFKTVTKKRNDFKADVIDEVETILIEAMHDYETDIRI